MKHVLAFVALCGLVGFAAADPIIYNNGAPALPTGSTGYSSQLDLAYPFNSQTADDFTLQPGGNIVTDVHWWGTWWNPGAPGNATAFNIIFYADAGGVPTGAGMPDPTPTAIAVYTIPFASVNEALDPTYTPWYSYDAVLSPPVVLSPSDHYWIAIQSVNNYPPQWGWVTTGALAGNANQGFPLLGVPYWTHLVPANGTGTEMAYYLTGIPEPASLLLLSLGALLLRRR